MTNSEKADLIDEVEKAANRLVMALEGYTSDPDAKPLVKLVTKLIGEAQILSDSIDD